MQTGKPYVGPTEVIPGKKLIVESGERVSIGLMTPLGPIGIGGVVVDVHEPGCGCEFGLIVIDDNSELPFVFSATIGLNHNPDGHVDHGNAVVIQGEFKKAA